MRSVELSQILTRKLIFVNGKGGVGKTTIARAAASAFARSGKRTLYVTFEDPTREPGEIVERDDGVHDLNCEASTAFEEYVGLKLGARDLTRIFLQNKLIRYLSKAAPGIHELVLLG